MGNRSVTFGDMPAHTTQATLEPDESGIDFDRRKVDVAVSYAEHPGWLVIASFQAVAGSAAELVELNVRTRQEEKLAAGVSLPSTLLDRIRVTELYRKCDEFLERKVRPGEVRRRDGAELFPSLVHMAFPIDEAKAWRDLRRPRRGRPSAGIDKAREWVRVGAIVEEYATTGRANAAAARDRRLRGKYNAQQIRDVGKKLRRHDPPLAYPTTSGNRAGMRLTPEARKLLRSKTKRRER